MKLLTRILNKADLLAWVNLTCSIRVDGERVTVPIVRGVGTPNLFIGDLWMLDLFGPMLAAREGAFVDVGANVGQTLIKLRVIDGDRPYVGFEPNPTCVSYLGELIAANGYRESTVLPTGVTDREGLQSLNFYSDRPHDVSASLRVKGAIRRKVLVPVHTLDAVLQEMGVREIALVKIDVEGAELEVIRGAARILEEFRPPILCEILPAYHDGNTERIQRQDELLNSVLGAGYQAYRILKTREGRLQDLQSLDHIEVHGDMEAIDYLFLPEGMEARGLFQ